MQPRRQPAQASELRQTALDIIASLEDKISRLERRGTSNAEILYELKHLLRDIKADLALEGEGSSEVWRRSRTVSQPR